MNALENLNIYLTLFIDTLTSSLVLPIKKQTIFRIMCIFENHNTYVMLAAAILGSIFGTIVNWLIGNLILKVRNKYQNKEEDLAHKNIVIIPILLFSWVDILGSIIAVSSGYTKIKLTRVISLSLASFLSYYLKLLYL